MMMMMMDQSAAFNEALNGLNAFSFNSSSDPDIDWSVFENADRYLLRDDSAWITRLSKDFWWNLERISEMSHHDYHRGQVGGPKVNHPMAQPIPPPTSMPHHGSNSSLSTRKIVGQRSSMLTPGSPMATNIPEKNNHFFPNFSSFADQDVDYNPFQSKISFDNHLWTNSCQQAIPWQ